MEKPKRNFWPIQKYPTKGFTALKVLCALPVYPALPTNQDFLVAQLVKNLPLVQEAWVRSLDWENPLEEGMATHSSILA